VLDMVMCPQSAKYLTSTTFYACLFKLPPRGFETVVSKIILYTLED
jgi:hypothetical protein